jgi:hypothetical protein
MFQQRVFFAAMVLLTCAAKAWSQEKKINLFKVVTTTDEIVIGLTADELKATGGADAHLLAQKGDMMV